MHAKTTRISITIAQRYRQQPPKTTGRARDYSHALKEQTFYF